MNTYEREERLKQIREARRNFYGGMGQVTKDIDFLLSLLDSQAVGADISVLTGYEAGLKDAATRMRELCVAKVRAIPMPTHLSESGEEIVTHFRARVVRYLESLTLDSVHRDSEPEGANR